LAENISADFYFLEIANYFKCPLRDIIRGEGTVIPAIHYWAKITKSLTGFLQIADY